MSDLNCPYCGAENEVNHDDGFGYEENVRHEMQCCECRKWFVFETSISFFYEPSKADCLNGKPHELYSVEHSPKYWPDWKRCKNCDYEERGKFSNPDTENGEAASADGVTGEKQQ